MGGQRWIGGRVFIAAGGDDALRGLDLRAPLVGAFALAQQGQGEHVRPGLVEQGADELGQALVADDRVERLRGAQLGDLELFLAARGLDVPAFEQFGFAHLLPQVGPELARLEERRVGKEDVSTCRYRMSPYY